MKAYRKLALRDARFVLENESNHFAFLTGVRFAMTFFWLLEPYAPSKWWECVQQLVRKD
jgi:hypothetical protein